MSGIGPRVSQRRGELGLSQNDLARLCEVSPTDISRWERGVVAPRVDRLDALATALGVSIDWLVRGDHLPSVPTVEGAGEVRS